jgi:hypothetical protein
LLVMSGDSAVEQRLRSRRLMPGDSAVEQRLRSCRHSISSIGFPVR